MKRPSLRTALAIGPLAVSLAMPVMAQDHNSHSTATPGAGSAALAEANAKMHTDMAVRPSGNVDVDFIRGMIPHHQGAIDMAKAELEHGTDPEARKLAEGIIKAQEAEIAWMQEWLKKRGD